MITAWRTFPWNPAAAEGEPFSAAYIPGGQGYGRFDLPGVDAGVRYFAETPEHAVAEKLVRLRNRSLDAADLLEYGFGLALTRVRIEIPAPTGLLDLCSARSLQALGIEPDETAFRDRRITPAISQRIHDAGFIGLRWWSAFFGEWHTLALYTGRIPAQALTFDTPEALKLDHPAVREAAAQLGISI